MCLLYVCPTCGGIEDATASVREAALTRRSLTFFVLLLFCPYELLVQCQSAKRC
jgi:hypothetical protein